MQSSVVSTAVIFLIYAAVSSNPVYAGPSGKCPDYCKQYKDGNKAMCDCCYDDPSIPYLGPCASASCMNGPCVDVQCKPEMDCVTGITVSCRQNCEGEATSCSQGDFLVYDGAGCKFCKPIGKGVVDPCTNNGGCNQGETCIRRDVNCLVAPCHPLKECRKICPEVKCSHGCFPYENLDGCTACKCCKYEL